MQGDNVELLSVTTVRVAGVRTAAIGRHQVRKATSRAILAEVHICFSSTAAFGELTAANKVSKPPMVNARFRKLSHIL